MVLLHHLVGVLVCLIGPLLINVPPCSLELFSSPPPSVASPQTAVPPHVGGPTMYMQRWRAQVLARISLCAKFILVWSKTAAGCLRE